MEHLFVSYETALALKEAGFEEHCLGFYHSALNKQEEEVIVLIIDEKSLRQTSFHGQKCLAPTYSQVIDFFDSKGIHIESLVDCTMEAKYCFCIQKRVNYTNPFDWHNCETSDLYYTRKESLDAAFEEALKLLP